MMRHHQQSEMAADNPEPVHIVCGCHIEFNIDFDEITEQSILHCDGDSWKHGSSIWNQVSTCYRSKVITTSGFTSAILIYVHVIPKIDLTLIPLGRRDLIMSKSPQNRGFNCNIRRDTNISIFPTFRPPSWICSWTARLTKSPTPPLKSLTPKTWR